MRWQVNGRTLGDTCFDTHGRIDRSKIKPSLQLISLLKSQKLIVICFVDPMWRWYQEFLDVMRHVVKCVVRCFQRKPWSGHKYSVFHGLHSPISSSDFSVVAFLSKISSDFASLWFILIVAFQFLKAEMLCIMTKKCYYCLLMPNHPHDLLQVSSENELVQYCCLPCYWKGAWHDFQLKWLLDCARFVCPMKKK